MQLEGFLYHLKILRTRKKIIIEKHHDIESARGIEDSVPLTCQSKWRANVANLTVVHSETRNVVVGAVTYQSTVWLPFLFSQFPKSFVQYFRPAHSRNSNN